MNELIKVTEQSGMKLVSARELHSFLGSKQEFATWIKNRIEKYGFQEGSDFLIILSKTPTGRPLKEYALTLDMAKEISMVENSEKGKVARRYFIEIEKKYKQIPSYQVDDPIARAKLWIAEQEHHQYQLLEKNKIIESQKQKVLFADTVSGSSNSILVRKFAKLLSKNGYEIGQNRLFQWLRDNKYLMNNNKY